VDFERLPAIMADVDSSLGELNLNNIDASEVGIDAMPGIPESSQQFNVNDASLSSEVILIAMEGVLRDSMEQHRRELDRLKTLARREEELAFVSGFLQCGPSYSLPHVHRLNCWR
jgi:hypothetical protein